MSLWRKCIVAAALLAVPAAAMADGLGQLAFGGGYGGRNPNAYAGYGARGGDVSYDGCVDNYGREVVSVAAPGLDDTAVAYIDDWSGEPVIAYDPQLYFSFSAATQVFIYAHECAHHVLGHTQGRGDWTRMEAEADCWAVRELFDLRWIDKTDLLTIQTEVAQFGQGDATHLPGPQRAAMLGRCA